MINGCFRNKLFKKMKYCTKCRCIFGSFRCTEFRESENRLLFVEAVVKQKDNTVENFYD